MEFPYEIRPLHRSEWSEAMKLAWNTFLIYEAMEYSGEGVKNFKDFVNDPNLKKMFIAGEYQVWGAFDAGVIVGILSVRNRSHISLLFVDSDYHRRGIGAAMLSRLFADAKNEQGLTEMTVNSAPYAVGFYHKMGFTDLAEQMESDGIIYTPMIIHI